jgi:WbqC-like protein family
VLIPTIPSVNGAPRKSVAIVQSSYIPWKGYFDLIDSVDEFILYDDQQFTRRDWRNRNRIKTPQGPVWLTIPVNVKGRYHQAVQETTVSDPGWTRRHWLTIEHAYRRAPHFDAHRDLLSRLYSECDDVFLSDVNRRFLDAFCELLGIGTRIVRSTEYEANGSRTERLVSLCRAAGATSYLSGPTARAYLDESLFDEAGIELRFMDYSGYPEYEQLYPPFEHAVSVIDLLVHTGHAAPRYINSNAPVGDLDAA